LLVHNYFYPRIDLGLCAERLHTNIPCPITPAGEAVQNRARRGQPGGLIRAHWRRGANNPLPPHPQPRVRVEVGAAWTALSRILAIACTFLLPIPCWIRSSDQ
jgi:hypothetical protein